MAKQKTGRTGRNDKRLGRGVEEDPILWAKRLGDASTRDVEPEPSKSEISRVMSALGRRGGKIGGKARMKTMTQEERSQIAFKAAQARWKKAKKP
jgi:hypothetical protein